MLPHSNCDVFAHNIMVCIFFAFILHLIPDNNYFTSWQTRSNNLNVAPCTWWQQGTSSHNKLQHYVAVHLDGVAIVNEYYIWWFVDNKFNFLSSTPFPPCALSPYTMVLPQELDVVAGCWLCGRECGRSAFSIGFWWRCWRCTMLEMVEGLGMQLCLCWEEGSCCHAGSTLWPVC
jgi:hypothetical protein